MKKLGIFGGSFNPIHLGHINSMLTVADRFALTTIKVIPSHITPLKEDVVEQGPTAQQRQQMLQVAVREYPELLEVDDRELQRQGVSYTIETVNEIISEDPVSEIYLIIGADQFEQFDLWKDYQDLLNKVNLVVTTRPGANLPYVLSDFPEGLRPLIEDFDQQITLLKSGKEIHFVRLSDIDISSTDIRKKMRSGRSVADSMDVEVERYVKENGFYNIVGEKVGDYRNFTKFCLEKFKETKAMSALTYDFGGVDHSSEFTLICSGTSTRQTQSLVDHLVREVKDEYGVFPYNIEGKSEGRWVVVDYGSLVVHVFFDYIRDQYKLEDLWLNTGAKVMAE